MYSLKIRKKWIPCLPGELFLATQIFANKDFCLLGLTSLFYFIYDPQIASVKSDVEDKGEKNKKFKSMIVKLKKDLSDSRKQELVHQEAQIEFNQRIQEQALQIDEQKVEAARLAAERENMLTQVFAFT